MGGIPGTSKGCNTCRRRKVGCDQGKPVCNRCTRTGRQCEGYDRSTIIHRRHAKSNKLDGPDRSATTHQQSASHLPSSSLLIGVSNDAGTTYESSTSQSSASDGLSSDDESPSVSLARFSPIIPPSSLPNSRQLSDQQLAQSFLDLWLPKDPETARHLYFLWLRHAASLYYPAEALRLSLRAVALSRIGWATSDDTLVKEGQATYVACLSALQQALWDYNEARSDQTMLAARVVTAYELFEATSFKGWNSHQAGMAAIYQLRGPQSFRTPLGRSLLESYRGPGMYHAIQYRTTSFLTYPEWREDLTDTTNAEQLLLDIGLRMAAFLHEQDLRQESEEGLNSSSPDISTQCSDLNRLLSFNMEMDSFYARFVHDHSSGGVPLYWECSASTDTSLSVRQAIDSTTDGKHSPLRFPNLIIAHAIMTYWALQALLSSSIIGLVQAIRQTKADTANYIFLNPPPNLDANGSADPMQGFMSEDISELTLEQCSAQHTMARCHHMCIQICRSVPYCIQEEMGIAGGSRCMFPTRIASIILKQGGLPQDVEYALQSLGSLNTKRGFGYANQLLNLGGKWAEVEQEKR